MLHGFYFINFKIQLQVYGHYEPVEKSTQNYLIVSFIGDLSYNSVDVEYSGLQGFY
jgi:hypothetical protein